jgi:hypothetical protein
MPALTRSSLVLWILAYCILVALAIYFSWYLHLAGGGVGHVYMYASNDRPNAPKQFNQTFSCNFQKLLKMPAFWEASNDPSKCGIYSLCKYPTTFAKQNGGCIQEDINVWGHWKLHQSHALDQYQDVEQPFIDAKVAAALCPSGPVAYVLKEGTGVMEAFIYEHIIPEFHDVFGTTSNVPRSLVLHCCGQSWMAPWIIAFPLLCFNKFAKNMMQSNSFQRASIL